MRVCDKCLENNWKYDFIDGWIHATCNFCGNEIEFLSSRAKKVSLGIKIGHDERAVLKTENGTTQRLEKDGNFYPVEFRKVKKGWQLVSIKPQKEKGILDLFK